jgi:hypothetical protein
MARYLFGLALVLLVAMPVSAQETATEPQRTAAPAESRYEIIQSHIAAKFTVRLDKYTGITYQLVKKANGDMTWQLMPQENHSGDIVRPSGKVNYQIFTSGLTLRDTFLININTGATWQLFHDPKEDEDFWKVIK